MAGTANSGGRNRKSAEAHKLAGTFQKVRHAGVKTPSPPKGRPVPPKSLHGDALTEWTLMVSRLETAGSLSVIDDAALYQYVNLYAETEELIRDKAHTSQMIDTLEDTLGNLQDGDLVSAIQEITKLKAIESRYSNQLRQGHMALRQYLVEFGMTPSARTRVKLSDAPKEVDPFDQFEGGATH